MRDAVLEPHPWILYGPDNTADFNGPGSGRRFDDGEYLIAANCAAPVILADRMIE
jgi:hypothetical protein